MSTTIRAMRLVDVGIQTLASYPDQPQMAAMALGAASELLHEENDDLIDDLHVHAKIREAVKKAGSCVAWARQIGISKSYAHDVFSGHRPVSDKVLAALGLMRVQRKQFYRPVPATDNTEASRG